MPKKERGLGRGLDALLSSSINSTDGTEINEIEIDELIPRSDQPRKIFNEASLEELAQSLKEHGMLQPLLVRPRGDNYEIIAGERRWRAARLAGLIVVPVIIREMEDIEAAEVSLIENLQRDDLTVIEEARAYKQMIESFSYTQEMLAERIGKSRAHVANTMRILSLPSVILDMIEQKRISAGHARAIIGAGTDAEQMKLAQRIADGGLSVRETEQIVRDNKPLNRKVETKTPELIELEEILQKYLGTRAAIVKQKKGGKIEIAFYNDEDLERIIQLLGVEL